MSYATIDALRESLAQPIQAAPSNPRELLRTELRAVLKRYGYRLSSVQGSEPTPDQSGRLVVIAHA